MTIKIYPARGMTGRNKADVVAEAEADAAFLRMAGFDVLCPVEKEKVKKENASLCATKDQMLAFWPEDKRMIRESHILFHMSPHLNSAGAWQEVGYKRYHLQGPVVHVYPQGQLPSDGAVPRLENDYVCDSLVEAIEYTLRVHGTFWKRTKWRLAKLNRCLLKSLYYQAREWAK
jgi:hypothetical protein